MYISLSIATAAIFAFVAWLFFTNKKEIKRPSYTQGVEKKRLTNFDSMLGNITEKPKELHVEEEHDVHTEHHEHTEDQIHNEVHAPEHEEKNEQFDVKQAMLGSTILQRKKKSH